MATLLLVLIAIVLFVIVGLFFLGAGGIAVLIIFGDVIIGGLIVYLIIRTIVKHRN